MKPASFIFLSLFGLVIIACSQNSAQEVQLEPKPKTIELPTETIGKKMKGVSLEMPGRKIGPERMSTLKRVNAEWAAMIPYGYSERGDAEVHFNYEGEWWGETIQGTTECIEMAQKQGFKIMLKPHVWVVGQGWPGDFDLKTEKEWLIWESSYEKYILALAKVAQEKEVDLFCVGTEYRKAVVKRPKFWKSLIQKVKGIYTGKLTYASNWDNFHLVTFWSELDYIGIDAYFPLSREAKPQLATLKKNWNPIRKQLKQLSEKEGRPILFTEYGYKSIEYATSGHWNYKEDTVKTSMQNQADAYAAFFETVWQEDWMHGGFLWKWHIHEGEKIGGTSNRRYTPQGKPSETIIREWYGAE